MRTAIYMGLLAIAESMNRDLITQDTAAGYVCVLLFVSMIDSFEFMKNLKN